MNYRILSLDGGGTWALIQLKALIALYSEQTPGHTVLEDFDLVAANSGGSIVLGGLVEDLTLGDILDFFQDQTMRESIFSPTHSFGDRVLHDLTGLGPKYSEENKLPALENVLPKTGTVPLVNVAAGVRRPGSNDDLHLLLSDSTTTATARHSFVRPQRVGRHGERARQRMLRLLRRFTPLRMRP